MGLKSLISDWLAPYGWWEFWLIVFIAMTMLAVPTTIVLICLQHPYGGLIFIVCWIVLWILRPDKV